MDNGVLLETKRLVELIRHYIRDQVRVLERLRYPGFGVRVRVACKTR